MSGHSNGTMLTVAKSRGRKAQRSASVKTRPSQPFGGRTLRMKAIVRARSTTSESPYLPGLISLGHTSLGERWCHKPNSLNLQSGRYPHRLVSNRSFFDPARRKSR
jgi:hypothetical protein